MTPKKLAYTVAGLVAACVLLSYGVSERFSGLRSGNTASARTQGPGYGSYLQIAGVRPLDYDAADHGARRDGQAWVLGAVDLEGVRAAIEDPLDLDALAAEDRRWMPTQTWKLKHGGASAFAVAREHCGARHLVRIEQPCVADIDVVVERRGPGDGRVVYARPRLGESATEECRAYADCVAKNAWLDREAPLPDDHGPLYGFKAGDVRLPLHGTKADWQASMDADIELVTNNLTALRRLDPNDPHTRQNIELQEDLLEQLQWMVSL